MMHVFKITIVAIGLYVFLWTPPLIPICLGAYKAGLQYAKDCVKLHIMYSVLAMAVLIASVALRTHYIYAGGLIVGVLYMELLWAKLDAYK